MKLILSLLLLTTVIAFKPNPSNASTKSEKPLIFGVGLFQPDKEKNDATYKPLADYLAQKLKREITLRTVDSWEGLAKAMGNGEVDIGLLGPWGYVLANNESGSEVVSTILYDGKPEYFALIITNPKTKAESLKDLKGKTFAFGDKGSTSGYLIPFHYMMKQNINPDDYFSKVLYTKHQAIETQVTKGELDAGADYNRNRNTMIEEGLIKAEDSKIIWQSDALPNDAVALNPELLKDKKFVRELQAALENIGPELKSQPTLLPKHYTGFVTKTDSFYKVIRDAGLATGKLLPKNRTNEKEKQKLKGGA